jgi:hypothetical protein
MNHSLERPLVSAVVVNHNGLRFLEKLFVSLEGQTYQMIEVVCVDSGSTDESVVFMRNRFPLVKVIASTNRGFGAACNVGARQASGKYIFFLNEDMHLPSTFVAEMLAEYQRYQMQDTQIGALACSHYGYDGSAGPDIYPGKIDLFGYPGPVHPPELQGTFIPGCPFFIRRKIFLASGGFCEHLFLYGDDTDLSWRLGLLGYHNYSVPGVYFCHYNGASIPGFPPRKIYYFIFATLVAIYNNYSWWVMPLALILSCLYALLVILPGLVIVTRGQVAYAGAVIQALWDFFVAVPRLATCRRRIQWQRVVSDREFFRSSVQLRPSFLATRAYRRL